MQVVVLALSGPTVRRKVCGKLWKQSVRPVAACMYLRELCVEQVQPGLCSAFRRLISCTRHSLLPLINSDIGKCVGLGADETIFEPGF